MLTAVFEIGKLLIATGALAIVVISLGVLHVRHQ